MVAPKVRNIMISIFQDFYLSHRSKCWTRWWELGMCWATLCPLQRMGSGWPLSRLTLRSLKRKMLKVVFLQISGQDLYRHWTDAIDCEEHCSWSRSSPHCHHHEQRSHRGRGADWARLWGQVYKICTSIQGGRSWIVQFNPTHDLRHFQHTMGCPGILGFVQAVHWLAGQWIPHPCRYVSKQGDHMTSDQLVTHLFL